MELSFFGIVSLTSLENIRLSENNQNQDTDPGSLLTENLIKIVHYPDCQQLIMWLPVDGSLYKDIVLKEAIKSVEIWRREISEVLSGRIQIILDTLPFTPGDFIIIITKNDGLQHQINIKKYNEGVFPEKPFVEPEVSPLENNTPIVYRDGFGNIIPDQDLILRGQVLDDMYRKFSRKVEFGGNGRSGTVTYIEGDKSTSFCSEMGGGDCIFYLEIPKVEYWEKHTGFSLAERDEILQFVAETTLRVQTSSTRAYFEIDDQGIAFMRK